MVVSQVDLNGYIIKSNWASGLNSLTNFIYEQPYFYVTSTNGTISQIDINGNINIWSTSISPTGIIYVSPYFYVTNTNGIINQIDINGSIINPYWAFNLNNINNTIIYNNSMYIINNNSIRQIDINTGEDTSYYNFNTDFILNGKFIT